MGEELITSTSTEPENTLTAKHSLRKKIRNYLVLFSVQSIIIIGTVLLFASRSNYMDEAIQRLEAVNITSKTRLEDKLDMLKDHVRVLSANQTISEAMNKLSYEFLMINGDTTLIITDNEFENAVINLKSYYNAHVLSPLNEKLRSNYNVEAYFPEDRKTRLLQHMYISSNPNPPGEKHLLDKGLDFSSYSRMHYNYHPFLRHVADNYDFKDIMLIDNESGSIVYSMAKNIDFGTNLISGPYRKTALASVYKQASKASSRDMVFLSDMEYYHPAGAEPVIYLTSPVFDGNTKTGVLAIEIAVDEIEEMVALSSSEGSILGKTGENLLVGKDFRVRNNMREFIEDPQAFEKKLRKAEVSKDEIQQMQSLQRTNLLYRVNNDAALKAIQGEHGNEILTFPDGGKKVIVFSPVETSGVDWALLTVQDKSELSGYLYRLLLIALAVSVGVAALVYFMGDKLASAMVFELDRIKNGLLLLSRGESPDEVRIDKDQRKLDELDVTLMSLNTLNERINGASEFARKLGKGDFSATYDPVSDQDQLGISLNEMKDSLVQAKEEEEIRSAEDKKRNWSTQGIAKFSDLLRLNNDDIEKLSYSVVSNLVEYLQANQAGIFVLNDEDESEKVLELSAAYAFDRRKYISRKVHFGEGLVGACALEQKTMHMKQIPDNYIHITSGLGEANPKSLLIVPMIVEDKVLGVIEIASFNEFEQYEIEFVEKIAETIGSTLITTKVNARTAKLLEESKIRAEEMAAQEEEMRQNMEELQATQDEMKRIKDEEIRKEQGRRESEEEIMKKLKDQNDEMKRNEEILHTQKEELSKEKYLMDNLMDSVNEHIYFKDKDSRFLRFSKSMLKLFGLKSNQELLGKSDFDFFSEDHARPAFEDEQGIIKTGEPIMDKLEKESFADGSYSWVNTSKMPLRNEDGEIVGTFGISKNVTHLKDLEIEAEKKTIRITELEQEIEELKSMGSDEKDKKIRKLEKERVEKSKELERIQTETDKTKAQLNNLRKDKKK